MFKIELRFFVYKDKELTGIQSHTIACATQDEATAIGHQIMSGPELYKAVHLFLKWVKSGEKEFPDEALLDRACKAGEAAIAKAEGQL